MSQFTINLAPKKIYPLLKNNKIFYGNGSVDLFSFNNGRFFNNTTTKKIENIGNTLAIGFSTPTHKFIACSSPDVDYNYQHSRDFFAKKINELREQSRHNDVDGIVYGGMAYDIGDPLSEISCGIVDSFEAACKAEGIEPTIISGRYNAKLGDFNSYIGEEQLVFWGDLVDKIDLTKDASRKQIIKALEKLFEYVKVSENIAIKIIDEFSSSAKRLDRKQAKINNLK